MRFGALGSGSRITVLRREQTWPARPEHVSDARRFVTDVAAHAGMPAPVLDAVRLAVSEAVANAVLHGYRHGPRGSVTVRTEARNESLRVVVCDDGCGMSPRSDSPGAGLGLPLIAEVADTLSVANADGGGTELCMEFALPLTLAA